MSSLRPVSGDSDEVIALLAAWLDADPEPEPLIVETSGSTGRPKQVLLSRRALLASGRATERRLGAAGRWVLALPISYVAGLQVAIRSLAAGWRPVPAAAESLADAVAAAGAGPPLFTSLVPTQLHRLLARPDERRALARFHTVLLGGGPIDPALRARAAEAGVRVVATYGSSETAGGCVYDGVPLDSVALALGADGRIRIAGPTLFEGYQGDPALTAQTLVDGWFLTSDIGRIDQDGRLQVLGRIDDVVISGGVNIATPAVARRLREHPAIDQAEVVGVPDPEWGHRVVAFVVPAGGRLERDVDLEAVRGWVAAELPRSWAPRELVVLGALPLLENGKVDRLGLVARAQEGVW